MEASRPSIFFLDGIFLFVIAAKLGSKSIVPINSSQTVFAGILEGPHITHGTRCPPSKVVPLPSRNGPADPP